jgi:2-succinyl-6-hydroxy-2,4-cyclohexadiene-1-carboxylate synthase
LHGFLGSHLDFLPLLDDLRSYHCHLIDLPSHGKSPFISPILATIEEHIHTIIKTLSQKPLLVGYSLGGRIAMQIAEKLPIKGLFTFSSHIGLQNNTEKEERLDKDRLWQERLTTLSSKDFLTLWYKQAPFASLQRKPELLKNLYETRNLSNPHALSSLLEEIGLAKQPLLSSFPCPTCLAFGEYDVNYKHLYEKFVPSIPQIEIPEAGHSVLIENPSYCAKAIKSFFP